MTIPKLTDDAVSQLPLGAGRAQLLEEIMSTVAPDRQHAEPTEPTRHRSRWLVPLAAAAVVAGIAGTSLWWQQDDGPGGGDGNTAVADQLDLPRGEGITVDAPGWAVDSLSGDGLVFRNGGAELEITSYDADTYASYVRDREHIVDPPAPGEPIEVLGRPAQMWTYPSTGGTEEPRTYTSATPSGGTGTLMTQPDAESDDSPAATVHTAIREVEDGHWLEFRGEGMDKDTYLAVLGQLRFTSQEEFESAMPDDFVGEGERAEVGQQIIDDITAVSGAGFPQGQSFQLRGAEAKDRYQFGAEVGGAYACAWLVEFEKATDSGDPARAAEAARVLGTSRNWPILQEMNREGDFPEAIWEYADQVAAGEVPAGYRQGVGCQP